MLNISKIKAISLDLDDTLWPVWPAIHRAEQVLLDWLGAHAPNTAALFHNVEALRSVREQMVQARPDLQHDLSALRRESIRLALQRAGEDGQLAEPAFEAFFAERQRVDFFEDALPALTLLAARFPLVALSNGNADIHRVGVGHLFRTGISAHLFGVGKPDARIFHAAAEAAGVPADAVLHVGDDALMDVVGALNVGMQAVWVNRADQLWTHPLQPHATVVTLHELCALLEP